MGLWNSTCLLTFSTMPLLNTSGTVCALLLRTATGVRPVFSDLIGLQSTVYEDFIPQNK